MNRARSLGLLALALACCAVAAAASLAGTGPMARGPRYSMVLQIVPDDGTAAGDTGESRPGAFAVRLTVSCSDQTVPEFPQLILYAGEKRSRTVHGGEVSVSCEAAVDADGSRAGAVIEVRESGISVLSQRVAVWLPPLSPEDCP